MMFFKYDQIDIFGPKFFFASWEYHEGCFGHFIKQFGDAEKVCQNMYYRLTNLFVWTNLVYWTMRSETYAAATTDWPCRPKYEKI